MNAESVKARLKNFAVSHMLSPWVNRNFRFYSRAKNYNKKHIINLYASVVSMMVKENVIEIS